MKRLALKLLPRGASSAKTVQKHETHPDRSKTILDNAITVFQQLTDFGSATSNALELQVAGRIGIQIVEICRVRPKSSFFDERNELIDHDDRKCGQIVRNTSN
jgi:hypothetical protein